ncbi:unnamed protein product [Closterium sp. NIES-53]
MRGAIIKAKEIVSHSKHAFMPQQFENEANTKVGGTGITTEGRTGRQFVHFSSSQTYHSVQSSYSGCLKRHTLLR